MNTGKCEFNVNCKLVNIAERALKRLAKKLVEVLFVIEEFVPNKFVIVEEEIVPVAKANVPVAFRFVVAKFEVVALVPVAFVN